MKLGANDDHLPWVFRCKKVSFESPLGRASAGKPDRAVVLRIEPPVASRPFGFHR